MTWHYVDVESGAPSGAMSEDELETLVRSGKIQPDTLLWHDGMVDWRPCREIHPGRSTPASSSTSAKPVRPAANPKEKVTEAACEECRKIFAMKGMTRFSEVWICAACKPNYLHRLGLGSANHAGFMIRASAKLLDGIMIGLFFLMPFVIHAIWAARSGDFSRFETLPQFLFFGYHMAYVFYSILFIGRFGATPGKMLCKIKVVTADGSRVGYGRAIGRFFAELASEAMLFSGYFMAAFSEKRSTLHDRLCNTIVINKEPAVKPAVELIPQMQGMAAGKQAQSV